MWWCLQPCECLLSSSLFFPSPPVETMQRNPELVLEGGPPAPLPPGDGFLETSIPVPAPAGQDGPRQSTGCAECVYPPRGGVCLAVTPSCASSLCTLFGHWELGVQWQGQSTGRKAQLCLLCAP